LFVECPGHSQPHCPRMSKLYRSSILGSQPEAIIDGLDRVIRASESLSLQAPDIQPPSKQTSRTFENSVSATYSYARKWTTIDSNAMDVVSGTVLRPDSKHFGTFLSLRCFIRVLLVEFCIFGASFARMFAKYYSEQHGLDASQWDEYTFCVLWLSLNWLLDAMDWAAIIVELFCVDRRGNSKSRRRIVEQHLSRNNVLFLVDAVSAIPFELLFLGNVGQLLCARLLRAAKIGSLLSDFDYLMRRHYEWGIYQHPISRLIFYFIVLFLHLIILYGSIWFMLVAHDELEMTAFLERDEKLSATARAFYYIMVTMFAVGYGDITPQSMEQVGFIVVVQVTGFFVLTGIIGSLVPWFFQSMVEEFEFTHRRDLILRFLSKHGNDGETRAQIIHYFGSLWAKCRGLDDNLVFSKYLPIHLRREVGAQLVGPILSDEKAFANAPDSFLRCLTDRLEFGFFLENDIIFHSGIVLEKLPILLSGDVEEFTVDDNNKRIMLRSITDGRLFAQNEFISGHTLASNFESKTNGLEICFVHRTQWNDLLQQYPFVAAQIFEYSNKRNTRKILNSQQSKKLLSFHSEDDDQNKQKSIEGLYLPHSVFAQRWNLGNLLGLLLYLFLNSLLLCFSGNGRRVDSETWSLLAILWAVDLFFVADMFCRKKVFAVKRGETVVSDPETVSKIYLQRGLFLDVLSAVPFEMVLLIVVPGHAVLGRVNRYIRLFRFRSTLGDALDFVACTGSKRNIIVFFGFIFIMLHLMACLWYLVGDLSHQMDAFEHRNWIHKDTAIEVHSETLFRWIRSLYFAFLTSFTVGYGGITPDAHNLGEQFMTMTLIVVGCASYFAMMGLITVWAEQANKVALTFERNFEIVKHTLSELRVDDAVTNDVRSFMSQLWSNQFGYRDATVLSLLPRNIRVSIMHNLSLGVLGNISLFANAPRGFMEELVLSFEIRTFCPNELMFSGNVVSDFFIVCQGTAILKARRKALDDKKHQNQAAAAKQQRRMSALENSTNITVRTLEQRDFFGLEALSLFNEVKAAREQRARRNYPSPPRCAPPQSPMGAAAQCLGEETSSDSVSKRESVAERTERERVETEAERRRQQAQRHRVSFYTSYEFEDEALRNCPFSEFAIKAEGSGFVTVLSIRNGEFEKLLQRFPAVKAQILGTGDAADEEPSVAPSNEKPPKRPVAAAAHKIGDRLGSELDDLELSFGDNDDAENDDDGDDKGGDDEAAAAAADDEESNRPESESLRSRSQVKPRKKTAMDTIELTAMDIAVRHKSSNPIPGSDDFYALFGLIHPLSAVKLWWNILSLLLCLYNVVVVPLRIAFMERQHCAVSSTATLILIDVVVDLFFCADVYLRFDRFTFIEEGFVEPNKSVIRARYVGHKMVLDVVSSVPWDLAVMVAIARPSSWQSLWGNGSSTGIYFWLRLFRLLRLHNVSAHNAQIDAFIEDRRIRIKPTMIRIIQQIIAVFVVAHWGACCFYFVGRESEGVRHNWLQSEDPPVSRVRARYLLSVYWSMITMSSVGFGDIKPQTVVESICGLVIMAVGVMTYAFTTAMIASFAAHANPPGEAFREKSQPIERYLKTVRVSGGLKERSDCYLDELWTRFKGVEPLTAISCVSESLQMRILESILVDKLLKLPLFRDAPKALVSLCAHNMRHELYIKGEDVVLEKARGVRLFLVIEGVAKGTSGSRSAKVFVSGTAFSSEALTAAQWTEPGTVVAVEHCHCFTLRRDDFESIVAAKSEWRAHVEAATLCEAAKQHSERMQKQRKSMKMVAMLSDPTTSTNEDGGGGHNAEHDRSSLLRLALLVAQLLNLWLNPFQLAFLAEYAAESVLATAALCWCSDVLFAFDWLRILSAGRGSFRAAAAAHFSSHRADFVARSVAVLPVDVFVFFLSPRYGPWWGTLLRCFLKLYHFRSFSRLLSFAMTKMGCNAVQKLLISLLLALYLALHALSCGLSFAAADDDEMFGAALAPSTPMARYLCCVYYVVTVVTTTGYGDMTPRTVPQIAFTIFLILCGNVIYASTIGVVSTWVGSTYSRVLEHFTQLKEIEDFCKNKKLGGELAAKVLFHHNQSYHQRSREHTLRSMPPRLQKQCSREIYGPFIRSFEYFAALSEAQCANIVRSIRTAAYLKGDVILSRGDLNDSLHVMLSGKSYLVRFRENKDDPLCIAPSHRSSLRGGSWFGDFSFFTATPAAVSVIAASETVETLRIRRDVLRRIIEFEATSTANELRAREEREEESDGGHDDDDDDDDGDDDGRSESKNDRGAALIVAPLLDENEEKSAPPQRGGHREYDPRQHPFLIFLEKFLSKNPMGDKQVIQNAVLFWRVKLEFAEALIAAATESEEEPTPQPSDDDEAESAEIEPASVSAVNWIENQFTFYDERVFDGGETRKLKEIQSRFANHDRSNAANCLLM